MWDWLKDAWSRPKEAWETRPELRAARPIGVAHTCPLCVPDAAGRQPLAMMMLVLAHGGYHLYEVEHPDNSQGDPELLPGDGERTYAICPAGHMWAEHNTVIDETTSIARVIGPAASGKSEVCRALLGKQFPPEDRLGQPIWPKVTRGWVTPDEAVVYVGHRSDMTPTLKYGQTGADLIRKLITDRDPEALDALSTVLRAAGVDDPDTWGADRVPLLLRTHTRDDLVRTRPDRQGKVFILDLPGEATAFALGRRRRGAGQAGDAAVLGPDVRDLHHSDFLLVSIDLAAAPRSVELFRSGRSESVQRHFRASLRPEVVNGLDDAQVVKEAQTIHELTLGFVQMLAQAGNAAIEESVTDIDLLLTKCDLVWGALGDLRGGWPGYFDSQPAYAAFRAAALQQLGHIVHTWPGHPHIGADRLSPSVRDLVDHCQWEGHLNDESLEAVLTAILEYTGTADGFWQLVGDPEAFEIPCAGEGPITLEVESLDDYCAAVARGCRVQMRDVVGAVVGRGLLSSMVSNQDLGHLAGGAVLRYFLTSARQGLPQADPDQDAAELPPYAGEDAGIRQLYAQLIHRTVQW